MTKRHGGTHHVQGSLQRGTERKPSPYHAGSGKPKGVLHAPPAAGSAVNRGGTFGMGSLKKPNEAIRIGDAAVIPRAQGGHLVQSRRGATPRRAATFQQ